MGCVPSLLIIFFQGAHFLEIADALVPEGNLQGSELGAFEPGQSDVPTEIHQRDAHRHAVLEGV